MGRSLNRAGIGICILIALGVATAHSAAAQVTFGSPGDPARIAIGGGAFDVLPNTNRADSRPRARRSEGQASNGSVRG